MNTQGKGKWKKIRLVCQPIELESGKYRRAKSICEQFRIYTKALLFVIAYAISTILSL
jgi:hypothetical protein